MQKIVEFNSIKFQEKYVLFFLYHLFFFVIITKIYLNVNLKFITIKIMNTLKNINLKTHFLCKELENFQ